MTGLPTLLVKLDDGTGTFPYDVTTFVRGPAGMTITRGRGDEFGEVQPSTLDLTFDNTTGVFTLGSGTFGITVDQRIQVTETVSGAVKRFTGYVEDWPVAWPDGGETFAVAQVKAVDRLARLARRKLRSIVENEVMVDDPVLYYTLGEAEGTTSAGDTSGNAADPLTFAGTGAAPVFGNAIGPPFDDLTAVQLTGGQWLFGPSVTVTGASNGTSEVFFLRSGAPPATETVLWVPQCEITMNTSGQLVAAGAITSPLSYADGNTHHVAVSNGGGTLTLYVDGASVVSTPAGSIGATQPFSVGGTGSTALGGGVPFTGTLAHAAYFTSVLSAARIAAHASAGLTGGGTDTADQRIARLASYANIATADQALEVGQQPSIAPQTMAGQTVLQGMQAVMDAEGGLVFIRGDGKLVMQNKSHRVLKATSTAALALTADQINPDVSPGGAKSYLINTATATRDGGAQQSSVYAPGVAANEEYPSDISSALLPTDDLVLNLLTWTTTMYGAPRPRMPAITLDLLTLPAATAQAALNLELGDLVTLSGMPSQTPAALGSLLVEGWTETLTHDSWQITLNTVPTAPFVGWILGDATYGVLGTTTRLYF